MDNMQNKIIDNKRFILAFGDSLTKGYYNHGLKYHPYSIQMNKLLEENNLNYKVIESGENAEVTKHMLDRIKTIFEEKNLTYDFSHVIIYAGSNDLDYLSYDKIAINIIALHKYVLSQGISTTLITLPQNQCDIMYNFYSDKRNNLNSKLKEIASQIENINICDLDSLIKYKSMSKTERKKYWDDHVHYTIEGYDLIGKLILDSIQKLL